VRPEEVSSQVREWEQATDGGEVHS
jgi:hypothetical protein